ncbi:MAG: hypothetical protein WBM07_14440, partial [Chitinivibrionales bacterium]
YHFRYNDIRPVTFADSPKYGFSDARHGGQKQFFIEKIHAMGPAKVLLAKKLFKSYNLLTCLRACLPKRQRRQADKSFSKYAFAIAKAYRHSNVSKNVFQQYTVAGIFSSLKIIASAFYGVHNDHQRA